MLKVQTYLSILTATVLFWSFPVQADLVSAVDINYGLTTLNIKSTVANSTLSDLTAVELNYLLKHKSASVAYVLSFAQLLRGQNMSLPYTRLGGAIRWYPMGFNGTRLIMDNDVSAQVWRATPFLGLGLGIANVSLPDLNASLFEIAPKFGVELPLSGNLLLQAHLSLLTGMSMGEATREATYDGLSALLGVVFNY